ncbi:MAG: hypothetical protein ABIA93_04980, partial [Candidatus Woesearchaeota archaeon]
MKTNNALVLVIALLIILPMAQAVTTSTIGDPTIGSSDLSITFLNQDPDPVDPGSIVDVRFKVENIGEDSLKNLRVELIPEYPLSLEPTDNATRNLGIVDPYIKDERAIVLKWRLQVDPRASEGEYELKVKYSTGTSQATTQVRGFYVSVESTEKVLAIDSVKADPELVKPGYETKVSFALDNLADSYVRNVKVTLDLTDLPFGVAGSSTQQVVSNIPQGETRSVDFRLIANNDAELKVYNVPFTLTYQDTAGTTYTTTSSFGLRVDATPQYVTNIEEQGPITSGSTGDVTLSISNTG